MYNALDLVYNALDPVGPQPAGSSIVSLVSTVQYHPVALTDYGSLSTSPGRMAEAHKMQCCPSAVEIVVLTTSKDVPLDMGSAVRTIHRISSKDH